MARAVFRFHGPLALFLPKALRDAAFPYACARAATLKNAIEALGVPHTEVGAVTVNGAPATLQRAVRDDDAVEVFPPHAESVPDPDFLADSHLGGLARFLRMMGFDTLYENGMGDDEIRRRVREERRVLLTRDRELLKCADVARGAYVRALKPQAQLREVAERFDLARRARPFTRCLECNGPLEPVVKADIAGRLPERVSDLHDKFTRCRACDRVYWRGSHYERMREALGRALDQA
jgi:uncharacterized protein with PIN domain/sulfur carrier protein ThiS